MKRVTEVVAWLALLNPESHVFRDMCGIAVLDRDGNVERMDVDELQEGQ